jgi:hypothetical protein
MDDVIARSASNNRHCHRYHHLSNPRYCSSLSIYYFYMYRNRSPFSLLSYYPLIALPLYLSLPITLSNSPLSSDSTYLPFTLADMQAASSSLETFTTLEELSLEFSWTILVWGKTTVSIRVRNLFSIVIRCFLFFSV